MMTKLEYCLSIIQSELGKLSILTPDVVINKNNFNWADVFSADDISTMKRNAFSSSSFAVAIEYVLDLKHTDPELFAYTSSRGGTSAMLVTNHGEDISILSTRDILNLLPETRN